MTVDEQAALKANVLRLRQRKGWTQRQLAKEAGVDEDVIGKIKRLEGVSDTSIGRLATALGVDVEQLFYYDSVNHEKAAQTLEEWEDNVQKVRRYLRSIDNPELRLRESRRLLKAAEVAVEEWEAEVDRIRAGGKTGAADAAKPRGGGAGGAAHSVAGETNTG